MKDWLQEKRPIYLERILQMKAGASVGGVTGPPGPPVCSGCGLGRPVWRCLDCTDKSAVCVLCCRDAHSRNLFHRVQKWNGRHYRQGALWQVGLKIHTGHGGSPCPRGLSALSGIKQQIATNQNIAGDVLEEVADQFGKSQADILLLISNALEHPPALMSQMERDVLTATAEKSGHSVLHLLGYLKSFLSRNAEQEADSLQADADQAAAQDEGPTEPTQTFENIPILSEDALDFDNDDWEDEDERPLKGHIPRFVPRPPPTDGAGNKFITVIHTNGFHALPVAWCCCEDHLEDRDLQLLDMHLYPASADRISTVFTFACLDDHRYDYLECKSSRYQYHNKLRRLTCPMYPNAIPSRYTELGRVSRQWRNLKYRKWFWVLDNLNAKRGEMALFCAACPQEGINLPAEWEATYAANPYALYSLHSLHSLRPDSSVTDIYS